MPRLFLAWLAALAAASWTGMLLAEANVFSAAAALGAGLAAFAGCALLLRGSSDTWRLEPRTACFLPLLALLLGTTLLPAVDTTLLSQDASIHRASGRWLVQHGGLGVPDPSFAPLGEIERTQLFGGASVSPNRVSLTRLPGGIVLPDTFGVVAYPSFSHLLAVWIAIAEGSGGAPAVALVGPLFAVTAWWAIALLALLDVGLAAALLAPLLLASLFPEHWFARFLMPEVLAQAFVWSGVAAARLAESARGTSSRARLVAGVLCGVGLGVSGFARLEQFWVFVPALLLARVLIARDRRVLPRGALPAFVLLAGHAVLHVLLVPTDYGNRIFKAVITVFATFVVFLSGLSGNNGYVTAFLLNRVLPALLLSALVLWLWIGRRIDRRSPGFFLRWSAAAIALPWLGLLYHDGLPEHFAALRSLLLYLPWPVWAAVGLGVLRWRPWSGLELALLLQAIDQLFHARVTDLQPWASRRVVTVVLPVVVLAAVRALAPDDERAPQHGRAIVRPPLERRLATALVALTIVLAAARIAPVFARPIQAGGEQLVRRVGGALPPSAYVIVAEPLGDLHLAAALWLGEGRTAMVAREQPWFVPALAHFLALPEQRARPLYVLAGEMAAPGAAPDPGALLPPLPADLKLERVGSFAWPTTLLESTPDRRPHELLERSLTLGLYRVARPPDGAAPG